MISLLHGINPFLGLPTFLMQFSAFLLLSDPKQHYTKEAWACMSHIVLEGPRKTR